MDQLAELAAIEAIRQLKARYFRLMDQKDWDAWQDVFTDAVRIDTSDGGVGDMGIMDGNATFRAFLEPMLHGVITTHHGHMSEITVTGTHTATGIWSMEDHLVFAGDTDDLRGSGWYEDTYQLGDDGRWRISQMTLRRNLVRMGELQVWPPEG